LNPFRWPWGQIICFTLGGLVLLYAAVAMALPYTEGQRNVWIGAILLATGLGFRAIAVWKQKG
jgi:hypothetical protein